MCMKMIRKCRQVKLRIFSNVVMRAMDIADELKGLK